MVQGTQIGQGHHSPEVVVHYGNETFKLPAEGNPYKGQSLRETFGVAGDYDLYRRHGNKADLISPEDEVTLQNGDHFFSLIRQTSVG